MEKRKHILSLLLLAALTTSLYVPAFLGWFRLAGFDTINQFLPWKSFIVRELHQGRLPLWNPYVFSGYPFIGNPQPAMFYPLELPALAMPLELFFPFYFALHAFLAAAMMYAWAYRRTKSAWAGVVGGLAWAWCGSTAGHVLWGFTSWVAATVYLPLGMILVERWFERRTRLTACLLAAALGLQVLAGHPQPVMFTAYFLLAYSLWLTLRRYRQGSFSFDQALLSAGLVPMAMAAAVLLSAVTLLPMLEASRFSAVRAGGVDYAFAAHDSLPPTHLITFIAPFFFGHPLEGTFWETSTGYQEIGGAIGLLPLVLACCAWRKRPERRFLAIAAGITLLGALGSNTPLFKLLYLFVPGFQWFRVPARMLLLFNFCLAALAALGAADLLSERGKRLCKPSKWAIGLLVGLELVLALWLWPGHQSMENLLIRVQREREIAPLRAESVSDMQPADARAKQLARERLGMMRSSMAEAMLWTAFALALVGAVRKKGLALWAMAAGLLLLAADLGKLTWELLPYQKTSEYRATAYPETQVVRLLKQDQEPFRVLLPDDVIGWQYRDRHPELYPERLTVHGIQTVRGYNPVIVKHYAEYINRMQGWPADQNVGGLLFLPDPKRMNRPMLDALNVKYLLTYQDPPANFQLLLRDEQGLGMYKNLQALPRAYIARDGRPAPEPVKITRYETNRVLIQAELESPGTLVLADVWYPGWRALVNGQERDVERYQLTFRAVPLEPGAHEVAFVYAPASFRRGALLSAFSWILLLALVLLPALRHRRASEAAAAPDFREPSSENQ